MNSQTQSVYVSQSQMESIKKHGGYIGNTYVPANTLNNGGYVGNTYLSSVQTKSGGMFTIKK